MSLGIAVKGPEGIVLAADSRITLEGIAPDNRILPINFDNATKLLSFGDQHDYVGAVTYGEAVIDLRTAHSYIPEFLIELNKQKKERFTVKAFSEELAKFFKNIWDKSSVPQDYKGPGMTFIVGGFTEDEAYGKVFLFSIPNKLEPEQRNEDDFGMTWGGQLEIASRIIHGFDPALPIILKEKLKLKDEEINKLLEIFKGTIAHRIPYAVLPLQDCIDLAAFLIRTTISAQELSIGVRGVGGLIEIATITRNEGFKFIQKKHLHADLNPGIRG